MPRKVEKKAKKKIYKLPDLRTYLDLLHVNNFKSLYTDKNQDIKIKFAKKITLLFGKNSAGKSSILQALKLIQQSYNNDDDLILNPTSSYVGGIYFSSYKDIISRGDISRNLSLGITARENKDQKTIIKKFENKNKKPFCNTVDFFSPSDTEEKFVSIRNTIQQGIKEKYKISEVLQSGNKYAFEELYRDTLKYKKKILPYFDQCLIFRKKFLNLVKKKRTEKTSKELEKLLNVNYDFRTFNPVNFRFRSSSHINNYKKFIQNLENNQEKFYNFLQKDLNENVKFFYKNNQTYSLGELEEVENFRDIRDEYSERDGIPENVRTKMQGYATLLDFLCWVVSYLAGSNYPSQSSYDSNIQNEANKTLNTRKMISFCSEQISKVLDNIYIFQGQKALPSEYQNFTYEEGFVGYNYEFLHKVIENNKKNVNKWLKHFGYDFKIETESGGPTAVTLINHRKENFKVNYKYGGLGAENVLPVIAQSVAAKNKTIVFEEPERRAHPGLQVKLADLFVECSKKNQFIIETHSENLLLGILKNIRDGKISHNDVQVSYVHINKGKSQIDELEINERGNFESTWRDGFFTERLDVI